ncbi:MAG: hypothetical protein WA667_16440, partial [Candidatus Nitrosopolaris sp.]
IISNSVCKGVYEGSEFELAVSCSKSGEYAKAAGKDGKINASLPGRFGEFEFHDPRAAAEFLNMPRRLIRLEQAVGKLLQYDKFQENN